MIQKEEHANCRFHFFPSCPNSRQSSIDTTSTRILASHKWIFKESHDHETNFLSARHNRLIRFVLKLKMHGPIPVFVDEGEDSDEVTSPGNNIFNKEISYTIDSSSEDSQGTIIDQYRSSLKPKTVEALSCTQEWLRREMKGSLDDVEFGVLYTKVPAEYDGETSEVFDGEDESEDD
ncbi:hypothetical protein H6P81_009821 [Aristolochia fimbriata]|uniref:HAT C-terminal dimerisation domain-containing protein n=1 Tax=Aristolochia fimbriata TaxID=158543 RepID=A0AAV7EN29_ARIFI|nr:hypothetical protein H6P81_009821 [Aristolochia fimbriata]